MSVQVMVPTAGGINNQMKRSIPNFVTRTPAMSAAGDSDVGRPLTGQVRSDPRVDPMSGDMPFTSILPTYNISDQNEGCMNIQQMSSMVMPMVINPQKSLGTEGQRARALPTNGNEVSMAWVPYDIQNKDSQAKLLTNGSIYAPLTTKPPFKRPPGVFMIN
jgi:hypothetical protein|tara:strand:+ start:872 stop:1354 length:483 start_codon:yes stop_codon:yes gene_type:complete